MKLQILRLRVEGFGKDVQEGHFQRHWHPGHGAALQRADDHPGSRFGKHKPLNRKPYTL